MEANEEMDTHKYIHEHEYEYEPGCTSWEAWGYWAAACQPAAVGGICAR